MNAHTSYAIIAILAVVGTASIAPAFAGANDADKDALSPSAKQAIRAAMHDIPITVWTDESTYNHDSIIMVKGQIANVIPGTPVTLKVTSPLNNVVTVDQIEVGSDGKFSTNLNTAGILWKYDGTYTIKVQYGSEGTNNKVLVELTGGEPSRIVPPAMVECSDSELTVESNCVPYSISGGVVTGASAMSKEGLTTLTISTESAAGGMLTIEPMRTNCNEEGDPLIFVDGEEWDDYAFDGSSMDIMFPATTESIDIVGTCVVPEFGTVAALILAVAIVSIVAVTAKSRLSMVPKF